MAAVSYSKTNVEIQDVQLDKDKQTNEEFLEWANEYPAIPDEKPDPRYASCNQYKMQYDGLTDDEKIQVKVACDYIVEYEDTIENRRYILECHKYFKDEALMIDNEQPVVKPRPSMVRERRETLDGTALKVQRNQQHQTVLDRETVMKFEQWKQFHTVKSWQQPDSRYAKIAPLKVQFAGMTDDGKILIKTGSNRIEVVDDTPDNKAKILERHFIYIDGVIATNLFARENLIKFS